MYAIVDIAGKQFKVKKNDRLRIPQVNGEVGKDVQFDRVLLVSDKGKVAVGRPVVPGASVRAKIVGFERGKKVVVFKKKRRKGYQVKRGHRQDYTDVMIESITQSATKKTVKAKEEK